MLERTKRIKQTGFELLKYIFWTLVLSLSLTVEGYSWWNSGWEYRKEVTIDNTGNTNTLTNYQVLISVDLTNLISQGKLQANGADIRMVDSDDETLIDYFLYSVSSNQVWAEIPSIQALGEETNYLYYGNSQASSLSSFDDTFTKDYSGDAGLIAQWNMDEGTGKVVADAYGNDNNGTLVTASNVTATDEKFTSATNAWVNLERREIYSNSESITDTNNAVTYTNGIDYEMDYPEGRIKVLSSGSMADSTKYYADYTFDNSGATWLGSDGGHWGGQTNVYFVTGSCLTFDGADDYVSASNTNVPIGSNSITYEAWIKPSASQPDNSPGIVGFQFFVPTMLILRYQVNFSFNLFSGNYKNYPTTGNHVVADKWQHVVGAYDIDGNYVRLYYDGDNVKTYPAVETPTSGFGYSILIGAMKPNILLEMFKGAIDEVRIYSRPLSTNEVRCHYERRKYTFPEPTASLGQEEKFPRGMVISIE